MMKKSFSLSQVYSLPEPGPVVMVTTIRKGKANIMTMSWHTMLDFEPPMLGCVISNLNYAFSILKAAKECVINIEVLKAWINPSVKNPRNIHHLGKRSFMVAGQAIKLPSKMK